MDPVSILATIPAWIAAASAALALGVKLRDLVQAALAGNPIQAPPAVGAANNAITALEHLLASGLLGEEDAAKARETLKSLKAWLPQVAGLIEISAPLWTQLRELLGATQGLVAATGPQTPEEAAQWARVFARLRADLANSNPAGSAGGDSEGGSQP